MNWLLGAHFFFWRDTLFSLDIGGRPWFCLKLMYQTLLIPHLEIPPFCRVDRGWSGGKDGVRGGEEVEMEIAF